MKNKGFTLVEVVAVVLILGLLATITSPIIIKFINTAKNSACDKQKEMILNAAERYVNDNASTFSLNDEMCGGTGITIQLLQSEGYLNSENLKNPKTKKLLDPQICITIQEDIVGGVEYNQYKYSIDGNDICS
ncbi:MAG: type II secretion system protein [Bacilli bacterium]|nr:type II secretion system protein [Bacilli bacterium]